MSSRTVSTLLLAAALLATPCGMAATLSAPSEQSVTFESEIAAAKTSMMADPEQALQHALRAGSQAAQLADVAAREIAGATALWLQGESLTRLNRPQEAAPLVEKALKIIVIAAPNTKLNGDLLMTRASIAATTGDVSSALQTYHDAYAIFQNVGAKRSQAIALQNIGSIYSDAGDYERVLQYYDQSAEVYGDDPALNISAHNNRGFAFKDLGRYAEAEAEFRQAFGLAQEQQSMLLEVRIMTNIATAQYLSGDLDEANTTATQALELSKDPSSSDWAPFLWGVKAQIAFARKDLPAAARFIAQTFDGSDLATTTMPFRDFHETAYVIFKASGETSLALAHLESFKRLEDEARAVTASTNSALMTAQFDFANQKLRISELKEGQLKRDVELADSRAAYRATVLLGIAATSLIIVAIALIGFFSIKRSRNEVRATNVELNKANTALEKALMARTEFLAMTSHEIRTPLNGILGMTQVLLADASIAGETRAGIELVHGAGETMKALVDDILDVAKMETGKLQIERAEFDLEQTLHEVGSLWKPAGGEGALRIIVDLDACPKRVIGDEQRLRQVAFNLMSNAAKFTEKGSVTLSAWAEAVDGEQRYVVRVSDTGIGIAPAHLERIFEAFQQVDSGTTRRYGGTGLGLAICRNLVRAMGGELTVDSKVGEGSIFTASIPMELGCTTAQDGAEPLSSGGQTALLVHGNLLQQSMIAAQLAENRFDVTTVEATAGAAALAATRPFDFILLHAETISLEDTRGFEMLRAMRKAQSGATIIVISAGDASRLAALQCGADRFLTAPSARDIAELMAKNGHEAVQGHDAISVTSTAEKEAAQTKAA